MQQQQVSLAALNPNFGFVQFFQTGITSNYQALQLQFQRTERHGIHVLGSYSWSHCIDFGSTYVALPSTRGNCDFDVRNNFQGGLSWDLPSVRGNRFGEAIVNHWGLDGRLMARTAFPITLQGAQVIDPATGNVGFSGVDIVPGQPFYLYGSQFPGGREINRAAFAPPPGCTSFSSCTGQAQGNAPRNFLRGFEAWQLNLAARREFPIGERLNLQFRAEAFNILNHPNFGFVDSAFTDATFGQATRMLNGSLSTMAAQYQQGGPRSMQFALKLVF